MSAPTVLNHAWPKGPTLWTINRTLHISIPFTWNLPAILSLVRQRSMLWTKVIVGGPAVYLLPGTFDGLPHVDVGFDDPGALQRVLPTATRTTLGCVNHCQFCAVPKINGDYHELDDWPDLPVLIDDNLLAASPKHVDRVMDRLEQHPSPEFNQGLDVRRLTDHHAERLARLKKPVIRLALDHAHLQDAWQDAFDRLRRAGVAKYRIRSYALIAFNTGPDEAWKRCNWIESQGIKVQPAWFHPLDATGHNDVTAKQQALGWNDYERRRIMQWFYQHKKAVRRSRV